MDFVTIIERIKKLRHLSSDGAMAEMLGFTRTAFAERKRRNSIPYEELVSFAEAESVNIHWLLTGVGPEKTFGHAGTSTYYDPALLREVIEAVEEQLAKEKVILKPGQKAELITLLYEEIQVDETKRPQLKGKILRLTRLVS